MSTRIKGPEGSPIEGSGGARSIDRVRPTPAIRRDGEATAGATDTVEITPSARQMLGLQSALAELPDIDQTRIARIQLAIEGQSYRIDADKIADRLLQLEGDLTAAQPGKKR